MHRNAYPSIVALSLVWLVTALCVACTRPADDLAIDTCALQDVLDDCRDQDTNVIDAQCAMTAKQQATRIKAGILPQCRERV